MIPKELNARVVLEVIKPVLSSFTARQMGLPTLARSRAIDPDFRFLILPQHKAPSAPVSLAGGRSQSPPHDPAQRLEDVLIDLLAVFPKDVHAPLTRAFEALGEGGVIVRQPEEAFEAYPKIAADAQQRLPARDPLQQRIEIAEIETELDIRYVGVLGHARGAFFGGRAAL
jgi:hypothetical protein